MSSTFGNESWSPEEKERHGYCNMLGTEVGSASSVIQSAGQKQLTQIQHRCPDSQSGITQVQYTSLSTASTNSFHSMSPFKYQQCYLF